jgi:uncharacterized protein (DUF608 family)
MPYTASMSRAHKPRSGLALGGIGCGWFELRHDGVFRNWNITNNRPVARGAHFALPPQSVLFFVARIEVEGREPVLRVLQIEESHDVAGMEGHEFHYIFPWLDGADRIDFSASVPFARLRYHFDDLPLELELEAWSPLIPRDAANSALPLAYFDFKARATGERAVRATLVASARNIACHDLPPKDKLWTGARFAGPGHVGAELGATTPTHGPGHASAGAIALTSHHEDSRAWLGWGHLHPYYERLLREREMPEHDDMAGRNGRDGKDGPLYAKHACFMSVGRVLELRPGEAARAHTFSYAWDFPNRFARSAGDDDFAPAGYLEAAEARVKPAGGATAAKRLEGHFYRNRFQGAAAVARHAHAERGRLERETRAFHAAFFGTSLPCWLNDQINSQLNTLRTSTWFTLAGDFGVVEGLNPLKSYAGLSTIDVGMYGHVLAAALFPELDRAVVRSHARFQQPNGVICHSISHNFAEPDPREANGKRIDLPAQFAVLALRCASWSDDGAFLREVWPAVKAALEYVLRERDANGDGLPDMKGIMCSYDNFPMYGAAPYVATQWLAALHAAVAAARRLGDGTAAARYAEVLARGTARLEATAWTGSYYRLSTEGDPVEREGCLTDQVIGEWAAHLSALPATLDRERVRAALKTVMEMNYKPSQGLRNCQWPGDAFLHPVAPDCWVDQANTCWTGVELAFASLLIYEGMVDEGLRVAKNVDDRYRRWGMAFDHQEFGGHYYRPMSAWAILPALLGQRLADGALSLDPRAPRDAEGRRRLLWVTPYGYGHYEDGPGFARVTVLDGELGVRELRVRSEAACAEGAPAGARFVREGGWAVLRAAAGGGARLALRAGESLELRA